MHSISKPKRSYRVLSHQEREEIMYYHRQRRSIRFIARHLGRNPSVISREIRANSTEDNRYQAYWAQNRSDDRRKQCRQRERIPDPGIRTYLSEKLKTGWSPEQISGRLKLDFPENWVSHETIYMYIYERERDLIDFLPRNHRKRRKRGQTNGKRAMIPNRTGIGERPDGANNRSEPGHWEVDTAVSKQSKTAIMVLQERMNGLTFIRKLERCAPVEMNEAIIDRLSDLPQQSRKTISYDNGQENRYHNELCDILGVKTYFCNPYSSWEKGSVENAIGLTRRFWPKKTDYALITDEEIANVEYLLNTRPRKRYGYRTPSEMAESVAFTP